jgi:hypothetical protein
MIAAQPRPAAGGGAGRHDGRRPWIDACAKQLGGTAVELGCWLAAGCCWRLVLASVLAPRADTLWGAFGGSCLHEAGGRRRGGPAMVPAAARRR